jgi:polysaccharide biosynthesis/export protein
MKTKAYFICLVIFLGACANRNLAYFSDLVGDDIYVEEINNTAASKIQPDDLINITVNSLNPEANFLFNRGSVPPVGAVMDFNTSGRVFQAQTDGYLVDYMGFINFPVIGKIKLGGLTKEQAKDTLEFKLQAYLKDPSVIIRYLNYRVTVIGEVHRPSTFTIPSERINLLAALGMAGDMTAFGRRENVIVIREEGGIRTIARLDLNSKDVLKSPYFYLQQNDVVYVEPHKYKQAQAKTNTRVISIVVASMSLLTIIIARLIR